MWAWGGTGKRTQIDLSKLVAPTGERGGLELGNSVLPSSLSRPSREGRTKTVVTIQQFSRERGAPPESKTRLRGVALVLVDDRPQIAD